jgi:hypothetical protein
MSCNQSAQKLFYKNMQNTLQIEELLRSKYQSLTNELDERSRRIWAATEAMAIGRGGVVTVSKATGIAESTIRIGRKELCSGTQNIKQAPRRTRKRGGGRKKLESHNDGIIKTLDLLVEPTSRGDPMSPLRWTCKSTRNLAEELTIAGFPISHSKVADLLVQLDYSLQGTRKTMEGSEHPDRNEQFEFINATVKQYQEEGQPVISVDAKKKELIGQFSNKGKEYQPKGQPQKVETYDFPSIADGKGIPYGVFDITANNGWVSVGVDHDTAQFAVQTIRSWWYQMAKHTYPNAKKLLITADSGGSNNARSRLWKVELQKLATELSIEIEVRHFPPGTSKWNKIEHRMFSFISNNWRGRPLISHEVVVNLIANTRTKQGLEIKACLDSEKYQTGINVSDGEMEKIKLTRNTFHGEWNYRISPG